MQATLLPSSAYIPPRWVGLLGEVHCVSAGWDIGIWNSKVLKQAEEEDFNQQSLETLKHWDIGTESWKKHYSVTFANRWNAETNKVKSWKLLETILKISLAN